MSTECLNVMFDWAGYHHQSFHFFVTNDKYNVLKGIFIIVNNISPIYWKTIINQHFSYLMCMHFLSLIVEFWGEEQFDPFVTKGKEW